MSFDYRTDVKDPKTGQQVQRKDYKLEVTKEGHSYVSKIEQPIGSGNFFHANGEKIVIQGEVQKTVPINELGQTEGEFNHAKDAKHKAELAKVEAARVEADKVAQAKKEADAIAAAKADAAKPAAK